MGIGISLKLALKEYGLTVAELSRKTGISSNTFYAMIRRDNNKISPEMLKKICENTDITVYDLLDNYDELAAKYYDPIATEEEQALGDYILTTMGNDDNLGHIIDIYGKLNNTGKNRAYEKISELEKESQFTDADSDDNISKYDASIRVKMTPELIEINRIENKIKNDRENVTEEELKILTNYYHSEQFKNSFKHLREVAQEGLEIINRLQTAYETLNENGQEKVAEHAEMIAKIPEYQKKPDEPPRD